jgi:transcriptional regulator with XRE-family HTH domain
MAIKTQSQPESRRYSADEVRVRIQVNLDKSGLTQTEYAERLGISQPMLSLILQGEREPNEKALKLIGMRLVERYYVEAK